MARTKQTSRKSSKEVLNKPGEWSDWRERNGSIASLITLRDKEVYERFKSMEYSPELTAATTLLNLSKARD